MRVIERLRAHVSQDRTCSAGMAIRRPAETSESVFARADLALYQAKAAGRDQACASP
jgi:PleD family two-component response regulator